MVDFSEMLHIKRIGMAFLLDFGQARIVDLFKIFKVAAERLHAIGHVGYGHFHSVSFWLF